MVNLGACSVVEPGARVNMVEEAELAERELEEGAPGGVVGFGDLGPLERGGGC